MSVSQWKILATRNRVSIFDLIGFLPEILQDSDPRPAKDQLNERYSHGGGYQPFDGFKLIDDAHTIQYPDDPPYKPLAGSYLPLSKEHLYLYPNAWLRIVQADGSWTITRASIRRNFIAIHPLYETNHWTNQPLQGIVSPVAFGKRQE